MGKRHASVTGEREDAMRLKAGQYAPLFDVVDIYGRHLSLAEYYGRKVLISFNRAAVCPLCNVRTWHLINRYREYQRQGMSIIAFFESSPSRAHQYLDRLRAPYPIIADLDRKIYDLYGLEESLFGALYARLFRGGAYREAPRHRIGGNIIENVLQMDGKLGRLPADFLVSPDLRIHLAYYGKDAGDFLLFSAVDAFAAAG